MVDEDWSRRYKDGHCIYLDEVLIKIREIVFIIKFITVKLFQYYIRNNNQIVFNFL